MRKVRKNNGLTFWNKTRYEFVYRSSQAVLQEGSVNVHIPAALMKALGK